MTPDRLKETETSAHEHDENKAPISLRDVKREVWRDFKKLAVLHDMTPQEFLEYIVNKEMSRVQISK